MINKRLNNNLTETEPSPHRHTSLHDSLHINRIHNTTTTFMIIIITTS